MAVVPIGKTFTQVSAASAAVLVQFRVRGAVLVAASATPVENDWIVFGGTDTIRFPAGTPVFARTDQEGGFAATRDFE